MFEVTAGFPSRVFYGNGKFFVPIRAFYTFGEPVEGTGTITISRWDSIVASVDFTIKNGEYTLELDAAKDLQATPDGWWYYDYTLTVTDSIMLSATKVEGNFQIVPFKYVIKMFGNQFITPGSTYSYSVSVATEDGTSFPPAGTKVQVTISPQNVVETLTLNGAGSATSTYTVPKDATYLYFNAKAPECQDGYLYSNIQYDPQGGSISLYPNYDSTGR